MFIIIPFGCQVFLKTTATYEIIKGFVHCQNRKSNIERNNIDITMCKTINVVITIFDFIIMQKYIKYCSVYA